MSRGYSSRYRSDRDMPIGGGKQGDRRGIAAPFANECPRCGRDMESAADMAKSRNGWIHKRCAGGGDDE